jgi:hypothetical protein
VGPSFVLFDEFLEENEWQYIISYIGENVDKFKKMPRDFPLRWEKKFSSEYGTSYLQNKVIEDSLLEKLLTGEEEEKDILPADALGLNKDMHSPPVITGFLAEVFERINNQIFNIWGAKTYYEGIHAITSISDGGSMPDHADGYLLGNSQPCDFSSVYYVNDDFEGGEIVFRNIGLSVKPKKNSLIIFYKSSSEKMIHGVNPVRDGTRYMSQCFFTKMQS